MQRHESVVIPSILTVIALAFAVFLIGQKSSITGLTFVEGNASFVNDSSIGLHQLVVLVNGSTDLSQNFTGNLTVRFVDNLTGSLATAQNLTEFIFDFSANTLNLTPVRIEKSNGSLAISNLSLFGHNKTVFVERRSLFACVKDIGNVSLANINENCTAANEFVVKCDNTFQFGVRCNTIGTDNEVLRIINLNHTGVQSLPFIVVPSGLSQGVDNLTVNITGQDFGKVVNITTNVSFANITNFTIINNTFMNLTIHIDFNATTGVVDLILENSSGIFRVHDGALRITPALNTSQGSISPNSTNALQSTAFNITLPLGAGVNQSTLTFNVTNITINKTGVSIVINETTVFNGSYHVTFSSTLPESGVYSVSVGGTLTQSTPPCNVRGISCSSCPPVLCCVAFDNCVKTISGNIGLLVVDPPRSVPEIFIGGGQSRDLRIKCFKTQTGENILWSYLVGVDPEYQVPYGGPWPLDDPRWETISEGSTPGSKALLDAADKCYGPTIERPGVPRCTYNKICNPGQFVVVEARPSPPCQPSSLMYFCDKVYTVGANPWEKDVVDKELPKCCAQKRACPEPSTNCYPEPGPYQGIEFRWFGAPPQCYEQTYRVACPNLWGNIPPDAAKIFSTSPLYEKTYEKWKKCCPGIAKPPCDKKPYAEEIRECKQDGTIFKLLTLEKRYIVEDPPCRNKLDSTWEVGSKVCSDPSSPQNKCWTQGDGFCYKDAIWGAICAQTQGTYTGDPACMPAAQSSNTPFTSYRAKRLCNVQMAPVAPGGPATLYTFQTETACDENCKLPPIQCPPCPPGISLIQQLLPNIPLFVGPPTGPFIPVDKFKCALQPEVIPTEMLPLCLTGSPDSNCVRIHSCPPDSTDPACTSVVCPPGSTEPQCQVTCLPGSTAPECQTQPQCPPGSTAPECRDVDDDCQTRGDCPQPRCSGPTCEPIGTITVDSPPTRNPIDSPATGVVPTPDPLAPVPNPPPDVYCAGTTPEGATLTQADPLVIDTANLPAGYVIVSVTQLNCALNKLDATFNVPDNYEDLRAFVLRKGTKTNLPAEPLQTPKCGSAWTENIRRQQLNDWQSSFNYKELPVFEEVQKIFAPTDAERIVNSGKFEIEMLPLELQSASKIPAGVSAPSTIKISVPTFDVPNPAHPNLVIVGTPLLVNIAPPVSAKVKITMPYVIPEFIDPESIAIYVRAGQEWKILDSTILKDQGIVQASVDDISLYLDNAGNALFAIIGITCATCPNIQIDKVYDGGSRKAVLLVHGFTTDRLRWQAFIDDLVHTNSAWQIWTVSYPLALSSDEIARELSSLLEQHVAEFDQISFITHSIGGIIVQKALQASHEAQGGARSEKPEEVSFDSHEAQGGARFVWPQKVKDIIMAGQPGLGSPSAEVYGRLFAALMNLKTSVLIWNQNTPLLSDAVAGVQVPRWQNAEYFVIAGRQSYPFTYQLFKTGDVYQPNDGIITIYSARTVGNEQITDACKHYFEVSRTHTDLIDDWLSRRIMERTLFRNDASTTPERAIAGYNKYLRVVDDKCEPGQLVIIGKPISESATADPLNCKCGNGICGEGETPENCPQDCVKGYKYTYWCRLMPWIIGPFVFLLVLLTAAYVYHAIKKHEHGIGAHWIAIIAAIIFLLIIAHYFFCGFTMPLSILILVFVLTLIGFTIGHLKHAGKGIKIDDSSIKELEKLLKH